jgi:hypothetical protein
MDFVADFETTTEEHDCRVWGWGLCSVESLVFGWGKDIDEFMNKMKYDDDITKIYFHNLKFDGEFVENWLFRNGFKHTTDRKVYPGEFSSLISDMGTFYQFVVKFPNGKKLTIQDSLKLIPLPVSKIASAFGLEGGKGEIDYKMDRPVGYEMTQEEIQYIKDDCVLVAKALKITFDSGLKKMTTASNAMDDFKKGFGKKEFEKTFPVLECDKWVRKSYRGGFTYAAPRCQGKEVGEGSVYDVNSLYPYVMYHYPMPYGVPIWYEGQYQNDKMYPMYIGAITCQFRLKDGMIPTIQLKGHMRFASTEYLIDSGNEEVFICLTSVDMEMFFKHYDVYDVEWQGGYKFKQASGLFGKYIDKWTDVKVQATLSGNKGKRSIAKLMMNSLYGKFGLNPRVVSKIPRWNGEMVEYRDGSEEWRKPVYVPVASFVTAYARRETITAAQNNYDRFLYADTDSLHLEGLESPLGVEVDDAKLGCWKHETNFSKAKFIRAKSYVEVVVWEGREVKPHLKITCAGMPEKCHKGIGFEEFDKGLVVSGKLQHKRVPGGVVLKDIMFTMKG